MNGSPAIPKPPMTPNGAELEILAEVARTGIMALPLGAIQNVMLQLAHERCVQNEWLRLIDVTVVNNNVTRKPEPGRVFKITVEGRKRLMELRMSAT